ESYILYHSNVSLAERRRFACRTSGTLHRYRYHRALQTDARLQRSPSDGLGRIRSSRRAICDQERPTSCDHHARECGQIQSATEADRFLLRLAARDQHHRSRLLQMDAVDFSPALQLVVQSDDEQSRTYYD